MNIGHVREALLPVDHELGIAPTRSGTSAEQIPRLLMRDQIIGQQKGNEGQNVQSFKRIMFAGKLEAMVKAAKSNLIDQQMLKNLANDFALSSKKMFEAGVISREEYLKSYAAVEVALQKAAMPQAAPVSPLPSFAASVPVDFPIPPHPINLETVPFPEIDKGSKLWEIKQPDPVQLKAYLQDVRDKMVDFKDKDSKTLLYSLMHTINELPVPMIPGKGGDYWDAVPEADRLECMQILGQISEQVNKTITSSAFTGQAHNEYLLFQLNVYARVDKLTRLTQPKMNGYSLAFPDLFLEDDFIEQRGEAAIRLMALKGYFQMAKVMHENEIYHFAVTDTSKVFDLHKLSLSDSDFEVFSAPKTNIQTTLKFVDQFTEEAKQKGMTWDPSDDRERLIKLVGDRYNQQETHYLPDEIYLLRKLNSQMQYFSRLVGNQTHLVGQKHSTDEKKCIEIASQQDTLSCSKSETDKQSETPFFIMYNIPGNKSLQSNPLLDEDPVKPAGDTVNPFTHFSAKLESTELNHYVLGQPKGRKRKYHHDQTFRNKNTILGQAH